MMGFPIYPLYITPSLKKKPTKTKKLKSPLWKQINKKSQHDQPTKYFIHSSLFDS
jgi:hypothetical protein